MVRVNSVQVSSVQVGSVQVSRRNVERKAGVEGLAPQITMRVSTPQ